MGVVWHTNEGSLWYAINAEIRRDEHHLQIHSLSSHLIRLLCTPRAGEISYLSIFGQPMIILNSLNAISELFQKRGSKYSDRPRSIMAGEMFVLAVISARIPTLNIFQV